MEDSIGSYENRNGDFLYCTHDVEDRKVKPGLVRAQKSNNKMTVDDLVAMEIRLSRQESPGCENVSFDRVAAHAFQVSRK